MKIEPQKESNHLETEEQKNVKKLFSTKKRTSRQETTKQYSDKTSQFEKLTRAVNISTTNHSSN